MQRGTVHAAHGADLTSLAVSATNHCLTGCATGEVTGMVIAISLGWSDVARIALAVGLAYLFGLSLTARPLIKHPAYAARYQRNKRRLGKQRGAKVAQVDIARRLTHAIWHMLTRNQQFAPRGAAVRLAA